MDDPAGFADFVSARSPDLLRSGWLLTGDWHSAHDLVQTALEKTWLRWGRLERRDRPEVYVRRVMVTTYLSWRRRRWNRESPYGEVPDVSADDSSSGVTDVRLALVAALRQLTPRQRAVLVLRYFDDLSESDTALVLGCSVGSVKAHASRGLSELRKQPGLAEAMEMERHDG